MSIDDPRLVALQEKLYLANKVIAEVVAHEKNISVVTPRDSELFKIFFDKEKLKTYGNSWIYVTQGVCGIGPNGLGYKYCDGENLCMLGIYPKFEHPDTLMFYWVRPMGKRVIPIIGEYAARLKDRYHIHSYVKKLFSDQYVELQENGFCSAQRYPWHSLAHFEDDTFPEVVYDRELTLSYIDNATRKSSLGRMKRGVDKIKKENDCQLIDATKEMAWGVVVAYFKEHKKVSNKIILSTPFDYYNMIFSIDDSMISRKILLVNGKPVGLYITEKMDKLDAIGLYCCLALRDDYRYLTDMLKLFMLDQSASRFIYSGGSEDGGMHYFKEKYKPVLLNPMYLATNYFP